ncbi:MAG: cold shock domain-containing protein [Candidatus Zixiibacteriota bacterium]|nr:MAG: cold shock domain-containing protein [candidate division Zixibacteria bacterium]
MANGFITEIDRPKGYGFIEAEDGSRVFFHQRWLRNVRFKNLSIGDEVVFSVNPGPRGPRAYNLVLASEQESASRMRPVEMLFKD